MNASDPQSLTNPKRRTSLSIKMRGEIDLNQNFFRTEEKVDEPAERSEEGFSALYLKKMNFPKFDETFSKIEKDKYIQESWSLSKISTDKNLQEYHSFLPSPTNHENISGNNNLLTEVFWILKNQGPNKYDENFTEILDFEDCENLEESFMLPIIQKYKEKDFVTLFTAFRPLLFDLLKRKKGFEDFVQTLSNLAEEEKIVSQNIVKNLEVKDILLLLVESCSQASLPQLGLWFSYQFYPIPLISLLGQRKYHCNLDCCLEYLFQVRKPLITNFGTKSAIGLGKSSFLSYLFSLKDPDYFSTKDGFTHFGAVDLYVNLPSDQQNYIVADVQSYREDEEFMNLVSGVLASSQVILVHLTEKDIDEDGSVNLSFRVDYNQSKIIYLWRDYNNGIHSNLMAQVEMNIKRSSSTNVGIIGIPKLNASKSLNVQNDKLKAMRMLFKMIGEGEELQNCTPIVDLFKKLKPQNGESKNIDFENEFKEVENLLNEGIRPESGKSLTETLLPCLFQDERILRKKREKKLLLEQYLEEMKPEDIQKQNKEYNNILEEIKEHKNQKKLVQPSRLMQKVTNTISSNELDRILQLSEIIKNWKMPKLEEVRNKSFVFGAQRDLAKKPEDQKNVLKTLMAEVDDKDLSLSTFLDEVLSYCESNRSWRNAHQYEGIQKYLLSCLIKGAPLNLVNGKTLKFGNNLLQEIFSKKLKSIEKIFVISIIGAQSSAKSTLLNALFGCGFSTSAGRCTKGIYISLLHHPSGFSIIVIDTEGLLSVMARDHEFENLITTMAFSCSHVVIINNRGEIDTKLRDLLEICVYAMKHLQLALIKPKIIFALRDIADNSVLTQREMLLAMKFSLEEAASKLSININQFLDFSQQDIFLLPPAFQLSPGQNKTNITSNNDLFSSGVLRMRQYIFQYLKDLSSIPGKWVPSLSFFYDRTEKAWNNLSKLGSDIMRAKNFLEIELKDEAFEIVNQTLESYNNKLLVKLHDKMKFYREELRSNHLDSNSIENFVFILNGEYLTLKDAALNELDQDIFQKSKFAILSNHQNEFKEIVEYNLRWQKRRFENEWRVSVFLWEKDQEIKGLKEEIRRRVNEKLRSLNLDGLDDQIMSYFKDLTNKVQQKFDENMKRLHDSITGNIPREILAHFESAKKVLNQDKFQPRVSLPTLEAFLERIKGEITKSYQIDDFYKLSLVRVREDDSERYEYNIRNISNEFMDFINSLDLILDTKPGEITAKNAMTNLLFKISKLERERVAVNRLPFLQYGLMEAMNIQYLKALNAEANEVKEKQKDIQQVIEKEEKYIKDLLKNSSDSFGRGESCAKDWFFEIKNLFCSEKGELMQKTIIDNVRSKFPTLEAANQNAIEESFQKENYQNCLKYILNTNMFIKEIYEQEVRTLVEMKILEEIPAQAQSFIAIINQVCSLVEKWSEVHKNNELIDLDTLVSFIEQNEILKKYLPKPYHIRLKDVSAFTQGCVKELTTLAQEESVKEQLNLILTEKVNQFLQSQSEIVTGCQARCPMCLTKCCFGNSPHSDHRVDYHLLPAFCGAYIEGTNELIVRSCFDPINYQHHWRVGEQMFQTFDEMIDNGFPAWRQTFPTEDEHEKLQGEVSVKLKRCWIALKDVLTRYYGRPENTPPSWFKDAGNVIRLPPDFYLEGYMKK